MITSLGRTVVSGNPGVLIWVADIATVAGAYTLTADTGSFVLTGVAASLQHSGVEVLVTYPASIPKRSRFLLDWGSEYCIEQPDQSLNALTGQIATFGRAGPSTMLDAAGNIATAAHSQARFEWVDVNGDGLKEATLLLGLTDRLYLVYNALPAAHTIYVDMIESTPTGTANGTRVLEIGDSGAASAHLNIRRTATGYDATHRNASTTVTATVAVTVSAGNRVQLLLVIGSNGSLTLTAKRGTDAEIAGSTTAANALAGAWNQPRLAIGSAYAGSNRAAQAVYRVRVIDAAQTLAFMQVG